MPKYEELSVRALYPQFTKDAAMMQYFPDEYPAGKGPPREYFFNILNTIHPDYLSQIMAHANKLRMTAEGDNMQAQGIEMTKYWDEQLKAMPYLTCKFRRLSICLILFCSL